MDTCSYFIINKALFGGSPCQEKVHLLESYGVTHFIDLTTPNERGVFNYSTNSKKIKYPIKDYGIPVNKAEFKRFIKMLCNIISNLKDGEKVYLHCKGGHGRCGIVVASILCMYYDILPERALFLTNKYHNDRKTMRDKWREIGSPQTEHQKNFVRNLFAEYLPKDRT